MPPDALADPTLAQMHEAVSALAAAGGGWLVKREGSWRPAEQPGLPGIEVRSLEDIRLWLRPHRWYPIALPLHRIRSASCGSHGGSVPTAAPAALRDTRPGRPVMPTGLMPR
jgi:hypothetical protein